MKILFLSDLHLTNRNPKFLHNDLGVSDLLARQYDLIEHIADTLLAGGKYDYFIFLGDWTDNETLDPITAYYSNKGISKLLGAGVPTIFVEGNHCIDDAGSRFTVFSAAEVAYDNFSEAAHAEFVYHNRTIEFEDVIFEVFPYNADSRLLEEQIKERSGHYFENRPPDKAVIMLFHFPTSNALLDNKMAAKKGVHLSEEITKGFDICVGGDYHTHQQLIGNDKAYYAGAPFDLKNGEHQERRLMALDIKSGPSYDEEEVGEFEVFYEPNPFAVPILRMDAEEIRAMSPDERKQRLTGAVLSVANYEDDVGELLEVVSLYKLNKSYLKKEVSSVVSEGALLVERNDAEDFKKFVLEGENLDKHEKLLDSILKRAGF